MDKPHCYKCRVTTDLSLKKIQRGIKTFICRPCRREDMRQYKARRLAERVEMCLDPTQWEKQAQESRMRILQRHSAQQIA